jgi:hypothetical protein
LALAYGFPQERPREIARRSFPGTTERYTRAILGPHSKAVWDVGFLKRTFSDEAQ